MSVVPLPIECNGKCYFLLATPVFSLFKTNIRFKSICGSSRG